MQHNMGDVERILRVVFGLYAVLFGVLFIQGAVGIVIAVLGGIALLTGALGFCPLYYALHRPPALQPVAANVTPDNIPADQVPADSEPHLEPKNRDE